MSSTGESIISNLKTYLTAICNAVRSKNGETTKYSLSTLAAAILGLNKRFTLGTSTYYNIKTLYPNLYANLTVDNFDVTITSISLSGGSSGGAEGIMYSDTGGSSSIDSSCSGDSSSTITKSYNATTGEFSVSGTGAYCSGSGSNTSGSATGKCSFSASCSIAIKTYLVV